MAASHPIRLDALLLEQAAAEAKRQKRTAPKQIEYWAELGRVLDGLLSREDAIRLREGLLRLEPRSASPVDPEEIFSDLEAARREGNLPDRVTKARVVYQASERRPGYLDQKHPDGRVVVGQFANGSFEPIAD